MSSVNLTAPNPGANNAPGALVFPGSGPGRSGVTRFWPTDFSGVGPRVGLAYQVASKTVIRGGFGVFYEALGNGGCGCTLGANGTKQVLSNGLTAPFEWDSAIPAPPGFQPPPFISPSYGNGGDVFYLGPTFGKAPRVYNFECQSPAGGRRVPARCAYVGNRGHGLNSTVDLNQVNPSYLNLGFLLQQPISSPAVAAAGFSKPYAGFSDSASLAQALRPYPQFNGVYSLNSGQGLTWYDSLQLKVERRFGNWILMGSYVRSKSLGELTYRQIFTQTQVYPQDANNLNDMKSYLPFDQPNVFNFLNSYELPFGRGKRFANTQSRLLNAVVGNWTVSASQQYRSGNLIQISCPDTLGNGVLFTHIESATPADRC